MSTTQLPSPHFHIRDHKRHSLYGTDDRIILDPGSRVWKVGFSAEAAPRACFWAGKEPPGADKPTSSEEIWEVEFESVARKDTFNSVDGIGWGEDTDPVDWQDGMRELGEDIVERRIGDRLKDVFSKHLMTDPKSRKLIVVENPLLPIRVKEMMARCLFEDLQVPSMSFVPPHLLALLALGRTSGLVVDVGNLEIVALPVYLSRPLYPCLESSPLASSHLRRTLYLLLLHFGRFIPPVPSLSAAAAARSAPMPSQRITPQILKREGVLERVLSEGCFVGYLDTESEEGDMDDSFRMDVDPEEGDTEAEEGAYKPPLLPAHLQALHERFGKRKSARALSVPVPVFPGEGLGNGTLVVPGWIRERVAEGLFAFRVAGSRGEVGENQTLVDVLLGCLMKLPVDLRIPMASSIVLTGGTSMLPNFIPRLQSSLLAALLPSSLPTTSRSPAHPYAPLLPLRSHLSILNNPSPLPSAPPSAGSAPAFPPALLPWIGGSVAGSLKISALNEVGREKWDEAKEGRRKVWKEAGLLGEVDEQQVGQEDAWEGLERKGGVEVLGDWTREVYKAGVVR